MAHTCPNARRINNMMRAIRANPAKAGAEDGYDAGFRAGMEGVRRISCSRNADPRHRNNPIYRAAFQKAAREGFAMGLWTREDTRRHQLDEDDQW
jgi:hypothetical protein